MKTNLVPKKCGKEGSYECSVLMPLNGRVHDIDLCISDIVAALNAGGVKTSACCCGHGEFIGGICLEDGRRLEIYPTPESQEEHRKKHAYPKACLNLKQQPTENSK